MSRHGEANDLNLGDVAGCFVYFVCTSIIRTISRHEMVLACAIGGAMSFLINIVQLESAINLARKQQPSLDNVLQPDVNALAEIYGRMIYQKTDTADLDRVPPRIKLAVTRWLPTA
jgi:hypothetical protein